MIIGIDLRAPGLAEVTVTPSWWQRLLRRRRASTWTAVLGRCGHWHRDDTGKLVTDRAVLEALTAAAFVERLTRPLRLAAGRDRTGPHLN